MLTCHPLADVSPPPFAAVSGSHPRRRDQYGRPHLPAPRVPHGHVLVDLRNIRGHTGVVLQRGGEEGAQDAAGQAVQRGNHSGYRVF